MKIKVFGRFSVPGCAFFALLIAVPFVAAQREGGSQPPLVQTASRFDLSPPLREIKPILTKSKKADDDEGEPAPRNAIQRHEPDPVVQTTTGTGVFGGQDAPPVIGANFPGLPNNTGVSPPDPNGDIGPNHYVQMVNTRFQIFSRTGTSLFGPANVNTLFSGFGGPCETENAGDPVVLYDQLADRWLLSQFTDSSAPFFNCVAISKTGDPTGQYWRYAFSAPAFPDYPKYGVWPDAYYLNTRESGGGVLGLYALERTEMMAGNPAARMVRFTVSETASGPNGLLPADFDGTTLPPAGGPEYFLGSRDTDAGALTDALMLFKFKVDWVTPGNSAFSGPTLLPIAAFDTIFPCGSGRSCIPQPGTTVKVDILSYRQRPTFRLGYRNMGDHESLVTMQSVEASTGMAGMRWWELRDPNGTPSIFQEGTYAPGTTDNIHRWMGSVAMDKQGNMAMGYSVSDANTVFPGIRFTGRLAGDPLGQMPQGEGTIVNGAGVQTSSGSRWGDYSSINMDPTDDCTFWYTTEYYAATSGANWVTRIASFKFPSCAATPVRSPFDFDGDGKTDLSIFRPGPGEWWYQKSSNGGNGATQFGAGTDVLTPGDFTGDGKADFAFWRPVNGTWFVLRSDDFSFYAFPLGVTTDVPVPADYDGDGKTDAGVFRPSENNWYINKSSGGTTIQAWGSAGDLPVPADYDGDGKSDIAIYRPSVGQWWLLRSTAGTIAVTFGTSTDKTVPGDYTGDGKADIAFWRPSSGEWFVLRSQDSSYYSVPFGLATDSPSPGDYDGDGKIDTAVFRPSTATWYAQRSTAGTLIQGFGQPGDLSVPNAFVR